MNVIKDVDLFFFLPWVWLQLHQDLTLGTDSSGTFGQLFQNKLARHSVERLVVKGFVVVPRQGKLHGLSLSRVLVLLLLLMMILLLLILIERKGKAMDPFLICRTTALFLSRESGCQELRVCHIVWTGEESVNSGKNRTCGRKRLREKRRRRAEEGFTKFMRARQ